MTRTKLIPLLALAGAVIVASVALRQAKLASASRELIGTKVSWAAETKTDETKTDETKMDEITMAETNTADTKAKPAIVYTESEKKAAADFEKRVEEHAALQKKLEGALPALPDKATPEQLEQHQTSLRTLLKNARKDAKQGEYFTPGMQALIQRTVKATLSGPDGKALQKSIMDENPGTAKINVNDPYPADAPIASVPIQFLETVPRLPEGMEYRFLGKRVVLVCTAAELVLDLTPNVLP